MAEDPKQLIPGYQEGGPAQNVRMGCHEGGPARSVPMGCNEGGLVYSVQVCCHESGAHSKKNHKTSCFILFCCAIKKNSFAGAVLHAPITWRPHHLAR